MLRTQLAAARSADIGGGSSGGPVFADNKGGLTCLLGMVSWDYGAMERHQRPLPALMCGQSLEIVSVL